MFLKMYIDCFRFEINLLFGQSFKLLFLVVGFPLKFERLKHLSLSQLLLEKEQVGAFATETDIEAIFHFHLHSLVFREPTS